MQGTHYTHLPASLITKYLLSWSQVDKRNVFERYFGLRDEMRMLLRYDLYANKCMNVNKQPTWLSGGTYQGACIFTATSLTVMAQVRNLPYFRESLQDEGFSIPSLH